MGSKPQLISPDGGKRLVRRDEQGRTCESDGPDRSLRRDLHKQGGRGDRKRH